jgi:hypothetical protein
MINIRKNVFETNSSSSHSITLNFNNSDDDLESFEPNEEGMIVITGEDFTGTSFSVSGTQSKMNLIATYFTVYGDNELKERFEKVVLEHTGAKGITYNIRLTTVDSNPPNAFFMPKIMNAYCYSYNEDDDTEGELYLDYLLEDDDRLKKFLFLNCASIDSEIKWS